MCIYLNQQQARLNFVIHLSAKQSVMWDAGSGDGEFAPGGGPVNSFPTASGGFPGDPRVGQLVCFAVNAGHTQQIAHNHLSGKVTIQNQEFSPAYEYSSWNFAARGVAEGSPVGTPGRLDLTGASGAYDACPAYNVLQFFPGGTVAFGHTYLDTEISVSTCMQDLREQVPPATPHFTRLSLTIWNAHSQLFTGWSECAASTHNFRLTGIDVSPAIPDLSEVGTRTALLQLRGQQGGVCQHFGIRRTAEAIGLVAVGATVMDFGSAPNVATTANYQGTHRVDGFVLWTPSEPGPQ
jgi:hypothetical protein